MKSDNCPDAIPKFLSSQQLDRSAGTLVNLATCYARLGRTGSAFRTYRDAEDAATAEGDAELQQRASQGITRLRPTLTKLVIVPPREATALSLKLNGEQLTLSDSAPVPLDPGENIIEAAIPGRASWRHRVIVTDRGSTIVVEVPELAPMSPAAEPANWRPAGVIVGGVGLAGIVVGSIVAASSKSTSNEASNDCLADKCNATGDRLRTEALAKARASTWLVGIGALTTAVGVGLWVASPAQRISKVGVTPWVNAQSGGLAFWVRGTL